MKRFNIRWLIITIPTSYLIIGGAAILLVIAGLSLMFFGGSYTAHRNERIASVLIEKAKSLSAEAENRKIPKNEIEPPQTLIRRAEGLIATREYRAAKRCAEDACQQFEYLLAEKRLQVEKLEGRYAKIIDIHGVVEVLPPDCVDWIAAGKGLTIRNGTRIRTQKASTAVLKFDDDSTIQMKSNSLIMIRELGEDQESQAKSSNIELGRSDIEAEIKEPEVLGSNFQLTMPDNSQAKIETEANLSVSTDEKNVSILKVYRGKVDVSSGDKQISLANRQAIVLDPRLLRNNESLKALSLPLPPRLIFPSNVQLLTILEDSREPLNFRWTTAKDAARYRMEIARDYYFYDSVINQSYSDNKARIDKLDSGNYYWRVSSLDKSGLASEPSAFNSFRIVLDNEVQSQQKDLIPPKVQIDQVTILGHIVDIAGKTEPDVSLFVNESKEEVFDDGTFRVLLEFPSQGFHTIFIEAYDPSGNATSIKREVTIQETSMKELSPEGGI